MLILISTLLGLILQLSSHPLQAANCCRNSRLAVDEDDLKWVENEKKISLLLKQFPEYNRFKTTRCGKLGHSSEMQNDVLMHREGLKGLSQDKPACPSI